METVDTGTAVRVTCENCGAPTYQVILQLAAVIIAVVALLAAAWVARMNYAQHKAFLRRENARARFEVDLRALSRFGDPYPFDGTTVTLPKGAGEVILRLVIKNLGDRAADDTVVNVITPSAAMPEWGEAAFGNSAGLAPSWATFGPRGAIASDEPLQDATGALVEETDLLANNLGRVTSTHRVLFLLVYMPRDQTQIPVKLLVESDDLPKEAARHETLISIVAEET